MKKQNMKLLLVAVILCLPLLSSRAQTIQGIYVSGNITGTGEVGGITGRCGNNGPILIKDCSVNAVISGTDFQTATVGDTNNTNDKVNVGGIVGSALTGTNVTVENCLVQNQIGAATAGGNELNPSGLIGYTHAANAVIQLKNSVVAAKLTGGTNAFWGNKVSTANVNVSSCYARNDAGLTNQTGGTLTSLASIQTQNLYKTTLGWDFEYVWQIKEEEFPILKWMDYEPNLGIYSKKPVKKPWNIFSSNLNIHVIVFEPLFLSVYDITGKSLCSVQVNNQISIPANQGIYILKLRCAGKETVEKIIVK